MDASVIQVTPCEDPCAFAYQEKVTASNCTGVACKGITSATTLHIHDYLGGKLRDSEASDSIDHFTGHALSRDASKQPFQPFEACQK